jgi:hypothetical protein
MTINAEISYKNIHKALIEGNRFVYDKKQGMFLVKTKREARTLSSNYETNLDHLQTRIEKFIQEHDISEVNALRLMHAFQRRIDSLKNRWFDFSGNAKKEAKQLEEIKQSVKQAAKRSLEKLHRAQTIATIGQTDFTEKRAAQVSAEIRKEFNTNFDNLLKIKSKKEFEKSGKLLENVLATVISFCITECRRNILWGGNVQVLQSYIKKYQTLKEHVRNLLGKKEFENFFQEVYKTDTQPLLERSTLQLASNEAEIRKVLNTPKEKHEVLRTYFALYLQALPSIIKGVIDQKTNDLRNFQVVLRGLRDQGANLGFEI